jgi:predicted GNAT family acetyltransferase
MNMADKVLDNAAQSRYEMELPGGTAFIDYTVSGNVRTLTHAEVPMRLRGAGIAARLTGAALDLARAQGVKVIPRCPYVVNFVNAHPQYQDLLAKR